MTDTLVTSPVAQVMFENGLAGSGLQNMAWNRNSVNFSPAAGITSDDFLSPEKQSDLFRRTIILPIPCGLLLSL